MLVNMVSMVVTGTAEADTSLTSKARRGVEHSAAGLLIRGVHQ